MLHCEIGALQLKLYCDFRALYLVDNLADYVSNKKGKQEHEEK